MPLEHAGTSVEYVGDGRLILTINPARPGARSGLEVRPVDRPSVVSFATQTSWQKGGYLSCPTLSGDWLVYTDVQDEPTMLSPGPTQPWKLIARNVATGEQRTLDSGMTDMGSEFACAVRDGERIAWTSGRAAQTTVYDLRSTARHTVAVTGDPLTFIGQDVVVARTAVGHRSTVVRVDPISGSSRAVASFTGGEVRARLGHLLWYETTSVEGDPERCTSANSAAARMQTATHTVIDP